MPQSTYESHRHPDPNFPVIFHLDTLEGRTQSGEFLHWHENVEMLFCLEGEAVVLSNADRVRMGAGDLAVVNSDHLHAVLSERFCRYYCLIVGKSLFQNLDLPFGESLLEPLVSSPAVREHFQRIVREMEDKKAYYKSAVLGEAIALTTLLCREYTVRDAAPEGARRDNRVEMVKSAVSYIRARCCGDLSIDEICRHTGFSKYYFCRTFKEITGFTVVGYINYLRCQNARTLISTGEYNVSESAERSGFKNMSYFTRTYKALMGVLPSEQRESGSRREGEAP